MGSTSFFDLPEVMAMCRGPQSLVLPAATEEQKALIVRLARKARAILHRSRNFTRKIAGRPEETFINTGTSWVTLHGDQAHPTCFNLHGACIEACFRLGVHCEWSIPLMALASMMFWDRTRSHVMMQVLYATASHKVVRSVLNDMIKEAERWPMK